MRCAIVQGFVGEGGFPQKTSGPALDRPRSLGPAAVPGPGRHRVMAENSFLIRRSVCGASHHHRRCEVLGIGSEQGWAPPRAHPLALAPHASGSSGSSSYSSKSTGNMSGGVLVHWTAAHLFHGGIRAKLWRGVAAVVVEECAGDAARCGEGKDFSLVDGRTDDVGPSCCVVMLHGDLLHRVVGPVHDEAAQSRNCCVCDVGNVVGMVLDFPTNVSVPRIGPAPP